MASETAPRSQTRSPSRTFCRGPIRKIEVRKVAVGLVIYTVSYIVRTVQMPLALAKLH